MITKMKGFSYWCINRRLCAYSLFMTQGSKLLAVYMQDGKELFTVLSIILLKK